MTAVREGSVAGSPEYAREYQRLRRLGLPTAGLADRMRSGGTLETDLSRVRPSDRVIAEQMIARGVRTSDIMAQVAGMTYEAVQDLRGVML